MTSCAEWRLNELFSSYSSRDNWKIGYQKRNINTFGQAVLQTVVDRSFAGGL
jgi:hypothetical protein